MKKYLFLLVLLFINVGCQRHDINIKTLPNKSPEELYKLGNEYMKINKPSDAVLAFEEIEKSHPYSQYIADSQIEAGKCYFKMKRYEEAISEIDSFVQINPAHKRVPEALYLLGCIYFVQMPIVKRDQENSIRALEYFSELCQRYPTSVFVIDAKTKITILLQHLAHHEFRIGKYYQNHKNFPAAVSRYNTIIESYPNTETAQESYLRLIECYLSMGLKNEALNVNKVLQMQHKNSKWAKYATKALQK